MNILVLNAGSSSLKFRFYRMDATAASRTERMLGSGEFERIGTDQARLKFSLEDRPEKEQPLPAESPAEAAEHVIRVLTDAGFGANSDTVIDAVGHRIVHGGELCVQPIRIDASVLDQIRSLIELAPLHNPAGIAGIEASLRLLPAAPSIAVFDTAFHHAIPPVAAQYALPGEITDQMGLRRFGFHGISYRYVSERLLQLMGRDAVGSRMVIGHLGNGASVCALRDGKSVDTSMGFTPLEGLVMGTRSGDVDPGLLLYLMRKLGKGPDEIGDLLNHQSGLLGLSGRSGDMRDLEQAAASGDERAELALACFAYRVRKYIGAYAAVLDGLDTLAFTAGIGENSPHMRQRICRGLEFLGIELDSERNRSALGSSAHEIGMPGRSVQVWVVPTNEELQIARDTFALLNA